MSAALTKISKIAGFIMVLAISSAIPSQADSFDDKCQAIVKSAGADEDAARLNELFKVAWERRMANFPEWASNLGYPGHDEEWTDISLAAIAQRKADQLRLRKVLRSIDRAKLNSADRLNYELFNWRLEDNIGNAKFRSEYMQLTQLSGMHQNVAQQLSMMPVASLNQCGAIIARLRGVPQIVEQTLVLLNKGLKAGITPPQITLRELPTQIRNQIFDNPAEAPMLKPFGKLGVAIPMEDQTRLRQEAYAIYASEIVPALEKLHRYVTNDYLPGCRQTIASSALPDGRAWYRHRVRHYTTTELAPEEIHAIGLSEVKRIRAKMDGIISELRFEGEFSDFCDFLRTDPRFYFTEADDLLREYRNISKRADPELIKLFGRLPRLPYGVVAVPSYAEKSQTTAYYQGGSLKAGRPGNFYANTYALNTRPKWEMQALTLHEAVPGHHLQISIAKEMESLPEFRRYGWFTAYGEGWALYAESLGEEMGFYTDPYDKFGQLTYEMWRAIRLVVDVGMHALGWSRQQAIDYFMENACKSEHDVTVEVDRYIVWPGQALAYKMGELKIKELRNFAEGELAESFDIRDFHDEILANGPLPLRVLETHMREWVEAQRE